MINKFGQAVRAVVVVLVIGGARATWDYVIADLELMRLQEEFNQLEKDVQRTERELSELDRQLLERLGIPPLPPRPFVPPKRNHM